MIHTRARSPSPSIRDGAGMVLALVAAFAMVMGFAVPSAMTMQAPKSLDPVSLLATLCSAGAAGQANASKETPGAPVSPRDHDACVACQCLWPSFALHDKPLPFVRTVSARPAVYQANVTERVRASAFRPYFSRAPPLIG